MKKKKATSDEFIKKAKEIHGEKYNYSQTDYTNTTVSAVCPKHPGFWQSWQNFFTKKKTTNWVSWKDFLGLK